MAEEKIVFARMPRSVHGALRPFSEALEEVLLPLIWKQGREVVPDRNIPPLAGRLRRHVRTRVGHAVHPALICYGLRLCCHFHIRAAERRCGAAEYRFHRELIDAAYWTIAKLEEHFGTYELRLLLA